MPRDILRVATRRPRDILHVATRQQLTASDILNAVANASGVPKRQLLGGRGANRVAHSRMLAMWLAHERTGKSLTAIGRDMGGRDHTTVTHAVNRWPELRDADADLARLEREVTARLERQGEAA